jgi:hypothetical protein
MYLVQVQHLTPCEALVSWDIVALFQLLLRLHCKLRCVPSLVKKIVDVMTTTMMMMIYVDNVYRRNFMTSPALERDVGTLKNGYIRNVPLPRAPQVQSAGLVISSTNLQDINKRLCKTLIRGLAC